MEYHYSRVSSLLVFGRGLLRSPGKTLSLNILNAPLQANKSAYGSQEPIISLSWGALDICVVLWPAAAPGRPASSLISRRQVASLPVLTGASLNGGARL